MLHVSRVPRAPLSEFVASFWIIQAPQDPRSIHWLFPDGAVEIIFNLGRPNALIDPGSGRLTYYHRAWISGERRQPILIDTRSGHDLIGIHFRPGGAYPFVRPDLCDLTDRVVELDTLWGPLVEEVRDALASAPGVDQRFAVLGRVLEDRLRRSVRADLPVSRVVREIEALGPSASIRRVADGLGVSHRRLIEGFNRYVGLRPKLLQRVLRFQRAVAFEEARPESTWASLAAECGYYDQAHLIRDFRAFTGITPDDYRRRRAWANYVPERIDGPA